MRRVHQNGATIRSALLWHTFSSDLQFFEGSGCSRSVQMNSNKRERTMRILLRETLPGWLSYEGAEGMAFPEGCWKQIANGLLQFLCALGVLWILHRFYFV